MFTALVSRFRTDAAEVKKLIEWQDLLRNAIHAQVAARESLAIDPQTLAVLRTAAPSKIEWQIFDHCATVTRLYALFEKAVCDLVSSYLALLPTLLPRYECLNERLRIKHRTGVGQILAKWSDKSPLYANLSEKDIASGLADGLRSQKYTLLSDAFLVDPDNFWSSALVRLFHGLGFDDAFASVRSSPEMVEFFHLNIAGSETADSFLDALVRARNEAAHGSVGALSSSKELGQYCEFTAIALDALGALLRTHILKTGVSSARTIVLGDVIHCFSSNVVGFKSSSSETIRVGDRLYGGTKVVYPLVVMSIRQEKTELAEVVLAPGLQCGIGLSCKLHVGSHLYRWVA